MVSKKIKKSAKKSLKKIRKKKIPVFPEKVVKLEEDRLHFLKRVSVHFFGPSTDKYHSRFTRLQKALLSSGINLLFRTYLSIIFFLTIMSFIFSIIIFSIVTYAIGFDLLSVLTGTLLVSFIVAFTMFVITYAYPFIQTSRRKTDIEASLPFALIHMSAVAGSGAPPYIMFKILSKFKEYGEITREAGKIIRNIDFFGLDEITSIKDVMNKTPSPEFKDVLGGILTTIQTGGSLKNYLQGEAEHAMFEYRLNRERYAQTLSTYADIYTAILIAAPLLFVVVLSILSVVGGQVFGMPVDVLMRIGIFGVIPLLNVMFLIFIHSTQPRT
ncbi:MAG: hypothetical protein GOV02_00730 [Candidatus Aenigmarchaeota archaeon]|nr:hypothetical protein [Candidatus Aenigmarchaeota archaeon]